MSITRDTLHGLVDIVDNRDLNIVFQVLMRFVPESPAMPDEIEAIQKADESIAKFGLVDYVDINWD